LKFILIQKKNTIFTIYEKQKPTLDCPICYIWGNRDLRCPDQNFGFDLYFQAIASANPGGIFLSIYKTSFYKITLVLFNWNILFISRGHLFDVGRK